MGEWLSGQFVSWMQGRDDFFQTIPKFLQPGAFYPRLGVLQSPKITFTQDSCYQRVSVSLDCVLGARELEPLGDVLRSIIPIPEAWWQNQMFAVNLFLIQ